MIARLSKKRNAMINEIQKIEDQKIKSTGSRPITFLTVVFVLTWAALIWFGWNAWSSYHKTKTVMEYHSKTEKLRGKIVHLDEVLTMSARMAAATGDLEWEQRYRIFEPKLDVAIKEAIRLAPEAYSGKASDTDAANIKLVKMENQSFDLIRQGRIEEAKALLFSDEYENQKRIYAQGMTKFAAGLSVSADTNLQNEQRQAFLRVGIAFLLIPLLIIVWYVAFRVVRNWEETLVSKKELEKEMAERKKAEEALRESEEMYRAVVEDTPVLICRSLPGGAITYVNDTYCKYFKKTQAELLGKNFQPLIPETDREMVMANISSLTLDMSIQTHEHRVIAPDGGICWHRWTNRAIFNEQGQAVAYQSIGEDITDRRLAEAQTQEWKNRYEAAILASGNLLYDWNSATNEVTYGGNLGEILGYSFEEMEGGLSRWLELIHPDDQDYFNKTIEHLITSKEPADLKYRIRKKDGEYIIVEDAGHFITDDQDNMIQMVGFVKDVTGRVRDEEALRESEVRLQQAQKMESIGTLAGGIAHDFNNILYSIIGYLELTMDDMPEGSLAQKNLKEVFKGAMRAKDMVQQILAFSRKADTEKKPIKVQSVVKEAIKLLRTSIPSTIEIRQNIDENCKPVLADSTQVHQVVMNLATNAYQAMREKGGLLELTLMAEEIGSDGSDLDLDPGAYLKLTVSDTGHGMSNVVMGKIFDPYFSTKGPGEGTGMGLAVVHGIVKDHGGDIKVYSELGEGTVFHVYLPLIETRPVEPKAISAEPTLTGTERILFVDDEEPIVFMAQQILERLGYQVTSRTSSVEALEAFKAKPDGYDLVITDLTMPNMTGIQLSQALLKIKPNIPIILCTGFSEQINGVKAEAVGISGYVMKPVIKIELAKKIREALDQDRKTAN